MGTHIVTRVSKVFTKYDSLPSQIKVAVGKDLIAKTKSDKDVVYVMPDWEWRVLRPVSVEELLEGARIVHYEG